MAVYSRVSFKAGVKCPPSLHHEYVCLMLLHVFPRTFAPMWDVFRVSSDKLALCHLELMRKMNDLIRDINKYGDEQVKIHRKVRTWDEKNWMP